ncbi:MAG TPA: hypothetical protein VFM18_15040 [Methanosarcina sp.]|nr:hypothetical protein [Methanosarcina sp.]
MDRFRFRFVFWVVGFLIGGALGKFLYDMFFPMCFLGLCIALAISGTDDEFVTKSDVDKQDESV